MHIYIYVKYMYGYIYMIIVPVQSDAVEDGECGFSGM